MVTKTEKAYIKSAIPNDEVSDKILDMIEQFDSGNSDLGNTDIKYTKTVLLGDWMGPSANEYTLTVAFSFHGIINPKAVCYEINGAEFELILVPTKVNSNNDIIITVNQTPDARFVGKIVID